MAGTATAAFIPGMPAERSVAERLAVDSTARRLAVGSTAAAASVVDSMAEADGGKGFKT
jgi:hypothetical protein